jgi:hypothetical protein
MTEPMRRTIGTLNHLPMMCLLLLACGDKDDTATDSGAAVDATFTQVYDDILLLSCAYSTCHLGEGSAQLGWDDAPSAYASLVGVASTQIESMDLVEPGAPDSSYLVWKLEENSGISGGMMPPSVPISSDQIAMVRAWIAAGAPND